VPKASRISSILIFFRDNIGITKSLLGLVLSSRDSYLVI